MEEWGLLHSLRKYYMISVISLDIIPCIFGFFCISLYIDIILSLAYHIILTFSTVMKLKSVLTSMLGLVIGSTLTAIIFLHYRVVTKMAVEILGYTMCRVRL